MTSFTTASSRLVSSNGRVSPVDPKRILIPPLQRQDMGGDRRAFRSTEGICRLAGLFDLLRVMS
jgi:hypothetical protein